MQKFDNRSKDESYSPYECAVQLRDLLVKSNLAPIMTMVMYEFLSDVAHKKLTKDASIYEYIINCFESKLRYVVLDNNSEAEIRAKSKAYLVLFLEIVSHAKLVQGIELNLQLLQEKKESCINVKFDPGVFKIDRRGYEFIENVDSLREQCESEKELIKSLSKCTTDAVDFIIDRYKDYNDNFHGDDIIIIKSVQA